MKFKIQNNTDSVDIKQKSLGLDSWVPGDSVNVLCVNRGLHVQIRHNNDKDILKAAIELSKLIVMAPELLDFVEKVFKKQLEAGVHGDQKLITEARNLIHNAGRMIHTKK